MPSVFSHEILNANPYAFLDDAPLEERRARAVEMRRMLPEAVLSEVGRLDPEAVAEVVRDAWPDVRDRDELHDALQTLIATTGVAAVSGCGWRRDDASGSLDGAVRSARRRATCEPGRRLVGARIGLRRSEPGRFRSCSRTRVSTR